MAGTLAVLVLFIDLARLFDDNVFVMPPAVLLLVDRAWLPDDDAGGGGGVFKGGSRSILHDLEHVFLKNPMLPFCCGS